jgi:ribosome-associated protein
VIEEHKAEDIVLLDLRPDTVIADFFVIATGTSDRQLRALADYIRTDVKEKLSMLPHGIEGKPESGWVLLDYSNVVVHLFSQDQREYFDLEGLWNPVASVLLSIQ